MSAPTMRAKLNTNRAPSCRAVGAARAAKLIRRIVRPTPGAGMRRTGQAAAAPRTSAA